MDGADRRIGVGALGIFEGEHLKMALSVDLHRYREAELAAERRRAEQRLGSGACRKDRLFSRMIDGSEDQTERTQRLSNTKAFHLRK